MSVIDLTPINGILENSAIDLFEAWKAEALKLFPHNSISVSDKSILIEDLRNAINSTLQSIREKRKSISDHSIGFFYGFVQSTLTYHWFIDCWTICNSQ